MRGWVWRAERRQLRLRQVMDSSDRFRAKPGSLCIRSMRRSLVLPSVLVASWVFGVVSASAQPAATTAIERCWYIVGETAVPLNLPHVSVAVMAVPTDRRL